MHILKPEEIVKPRALVEIKPGETETDWHGEQPLLGGNTERVVLAPDRQWTKWITEYELQRNNLFDQFACVTQTAWNGEQAVVNRVYEIVHNYSKRFTAVLGGTTPRVGADINAIYECIRNKGGVKESVWPSMTPSMTEAEFFKPIPQEVQDQESFLKEGWIFKHEWVTRPTFSPGPTADKIWEELKYSPIAGAIDGGYTFENGLLSYASFKSYTHVILIVGGEYGKYWLVLDSENPQGLMKVAWNYKFAYCKAMYVTKTKDLQEFLREVEDRGVKELNSNKVYYIFMGEKRWIPDEALMTMCKVNPSNLVVDTYNLLPQIPNGPDVDINFIPIDRIEEIKYQILQLRDPKFMEDRYAKYFPDLFPKK
jgi:hypothetical protein